MGWLIFRSREFLPEELVFSVNYLGNAQPTFTFNFSRGSAMIQAQYYNFIRLGRSARGPFFVAAATRGGRRGSLAPRRVA